MILLSVTRKNSNFQISFPNKSENMLDLKAQILPSSNLFLSELVKTKLHFCHRRREIRKTNQN